MTSPALDLDAAERHRTLFLLDARIAAARVELSRLQACVAACDRLRVGGHEAQLVSANERLVLSALDARADAQAVRDDLVALAKASQRDALTDIPGRSLTQDRLETAIASARRHDRKLGVLFVDLDGFKRINDTLGHVAGDRSLRTAARRLTDAVRESDTVGRIGGDEFLVILPDIEGHAEAALVAAKMLAAMSDASVDEPAMSASIGIALYPQDAPTSADLVDCADKAMYRAKADGGGRSAFHAMPAFAEPPKEHAAGWDDRPLLDPQAYEAHRADLRQANEHLVLAVVSARRLQSRAEELHERQAMFLVRVAHELRHPLNPIRNAAELLQHAQANEGLLGQVQGILRRQVDHMARLVGDLLDGARAGTGKFRLECGPIALETILVPVVDAARPAIARRQQTMTTRLPPDSVLVQADPLRLAQVFSNLLDNASKYTPQGGTIDVALDCVDSAASLCVSDNGIGISSEALPQVFDLFMQEPHARAHDGQGLGLGLTIVRELVEAHGGTIVAFSRGHGLGSQFVVTLPVLRSAS